MLPPPSRVRQIANPSTPTNIVSASAGSKAIDQTVRISPGRASEAQLSPPSSLR